MQEQIIHLDVFEQIDSLIQEFMIKNVAGHGPKKLQIDPITEKYMESICRQGINVSDSVKLKEYKGLSIEVIQTNLFYLNVM